MLALVACMLSPLYPLAPVPATVDIILVDAVTLRIRLLNSSAIYTLPKDECIRVIQQEIRRDLHGKDVVLPETSVQSPTGYAKVALLATPPSPL